MDSRTTASPGATDQYVFYGIGGMSWAVPYIAGVYALAVQVDPAITPERFWASRANRVPSMNWHAKPLGPSLIGPIDSCVQAGETATLSRPSKGVAK
jgi:hypothetical protein